MKTIRPDKRPCVHCGRLTLRTTFHAPEAAEPCCGRCSAPEARQSASPVLRAHIAAHWKCRDCGSELQPHEWYEPARGPRFEWTDHLCAGCWLGQTAGLCATCKREPASAGLTCELHHQPICVGCRQAQRDDIHGRPERSARELALAHFRYYHRRGDRMHDCLNMGHSEPHGRDVQCWSGIVRVERLADGSACGERFGIETIWRELDREVTTGTQASLF